MEWRVITATFGAVFLAELADKTQLVGMAMASKSGRPLSVWIGSVAAFMVVTVITVLLGALLGKYLKPEIVKYSAAVLFIILGVLILFDKL